MPSVLWYEVMPDMLWNEVMLGVLLVLGNGEVILGCYSPT